MVIDLFACNLKSNKNVNFLKVRKNLKDSFLKFSKKRYPNIDYKNHKIVKKIKTLIMKIRVLSRK